MPVLIERLRPRGDVPEAPVQEAGGFKLADPKHGNERHHARNSVYAATIEQAADLIEKHGFSIWMVRPGKRASLICPSSLRITRT